MNLSLNKQKVLNVLFAFFFVLLLSYFGWDMSIRVRDSFVSQGYDIAIDDIITGAENRECQPFRLSLGERSVQFINIECLQTPDEPGIVSPGTQE